ncbi:hypothetical protein AABB24_002713 [Solanum stoloniferum]|uniref:Uncharacterized protein n=1 Tax=Solanum stoloniferum TaxID=62892 RepID=A0ABD2V4W8_9SOLN
MSLIPKKWVVDYTEQQKWVVDLYMWLVVYTELVIWKALEKKGHPHCYKLVHSVAWNCSGTKLASGYVDQTGRIWKFEPHVHGRSLLENEIEPNDQGSEGYYCLSLVKLSFYNFWFSLISRHL